MRALALIGAALLAGCGPAEAGDGTAPPPVPAEIFVPVKDWPFGDRTALAETRAVASADAALHPRFGRVAVRSSHVLPVGAEARLADYYAKALEGAGWGRLPPTPIARGQLTAWSKGGALFGLLLLEGGPAQRPALILVNDKTGR